MGAVVLDHHCGDHCFKTCGVKTSANGAAIATYRIGTAAQKCKMMNPPAFEQTGAFPFAIGMMSLKLMSACINTIKWPTQVQGLQNL